MSSLDQHRCRDRVGAVVVSHYPEVEALLKLIAALSSQVVHIALIDNGSAAAVIDSLQERIEAKNISITALRENRGIAAAQNIGISMLSLQGVEYILLLDQDSVPCNGMVERLVFAAGNLARCGIRLGAVGPWWIDRRTNAKARIRTIDSDGRHDVSWLSNAVRAIETDFMISSGSLLCATAIQDVGSMNEGYFIDHVDTEWCLRARARGWRLFIVTDVHMPHVLGEQVMRFPLGFRREVAIHSPIRNYYVLRNTVLMLRHAPMSHQVRFFHLVRALRFLVFFGLLVSPRWMRLKMMLTGIAHGLLDRAGKFSHTGTESSDRKRNA